jgi:hypothetical protein
MTGTLSLFLCNSIRGHQDAPPTKQGGEATGPVVFLSAGAAFLLPGVCCPGAEAESPEQPIQ